MKILIVTHHFLDGNGGGVFASRAYINAFAELYSDVTLMYPAKERHPIEHISKSVKLIPVTYDIPKLQKLWHILTGMSHRYMEAFRKEIQNNKYDIVVFDTSNVTWKTIDIARQAGAKVITIHHNYQMEYDRDNCMPLLRPTILYWTKKREGHSVRNSDLNLTLTKQDKELLYNHYDSQRRSNIQVLGCFEYERKQQTEIIESNSNSNRFVITGNLSAVQTEVSLNAWLSEYYPILKQEYPSHTLTIAGKNPSAKLIHKCQELGIHIIPSPESMDAILDEADYYICPTALGGGLKLRIMDGLRRGLPVLTHEVSARGYDVFKENKIIFSYYNKNSFNNALRKIVEQNNSKENIIRCYQEKFSFDNGVKRMKDLLSYCL